MHCVIERLSLLTFIPTTELEQSPTQALCYMRTMESDEEERYAEQQRKKNGCRPQTRLCNSR